MRRFFALTLLIALAASSGTAASADPPGGPKPHKFGPHTLFGFIQSITGTTLMLRKKHGQIIAADISDAVVSDELGVLYVGRPVALHGDYDTTPRRLYHVNSITSANGLRFRSDPPDQ
jgi:hypothetical protein